MKINEQNFIMQLCKGDEKALEYVVDIYGGLIYSVVRKQLSALPDLQQECVNDVLLAIWQHCDSFDANRSTFANWIAGICRYKAIDCRRKWLSRMETSALESIEWVVDCKAHAAMLEQEIFEEIEQMLDCLAPDDQVLFRKLYLDEISPEEVASELGMSRSNVYNRVSRGRKRIQQQYTKNKR